MEYNVSLEKAREYRDWADDSWAEAAYELLSKLGAHKREHTTSVTIAGQKLRTAFVLNAHEIHFQAEKSDKYPRSDVIPGLFRVVRSSNWVQRLFNEQQLKQ